MEQLAAIAAIGPEGDFGAANDRERFLLRPKGMLLFANAEPGTQIVFSPRNTDSDLWHKID
jgi:hypothetical protein